MTNRNYFTIALLLIFQLMIVYYPQILFSQTADTSTGEQSKNRLRPDPGQTWTDPATGMEFVWVPEGCFQMGNPDKSVENENPRHKVCLDGFWIGKYEVTQGQWEEIMGSNPSEFQSGDDFPVETVSWNDAKKFISKLSQKSGNTFKLPTEAQWEYAARSGGENQEYAGGSDYKNVSWCRLTNGGKTHVVGTKAPNDLGIYDMSGNVWEWCEDAFDPDAYSKHGLHNPLITSGSSARVIRGGCYTDKPIATTFRIRYIANDRYQGLGFRLCAADVDLNIKSNSISNDGRPDKNVDQIRGDNAAKTGGYILFDSPFFSLERPSLWNTFTDQEIESLKKQTEKGIKQLYSSVYGELKKNEIEIKYLNGFTTDQSKKVIVLEVLHVPTNVKNHLEKKQLVSKKVFADQIQAGQIKNVISNQIVYLNGRQALLNDLIYVNGKRLMAYTTSLPNFSNKTIKIMMISYELADKVIFDHMVNSLDTKKSTKSEKNHKGVRESGVKIEGINGNIHEEFRGIKWLTSETKMRSMLEVAPDKSKSHTIAFEKPNDNLTLGNIKLSSVTYHVNKHTHNFYHVVMELDRDKFKNTELRKATYDELKRIFTQIMGQKEVLKSGEDLIWRKPRLEIWLYKMRYIYITYINYKKRR